MNEKEEPKIIQVSEDKLRLTLKEQSELKASSAKFWTFLSFALAFGIPLFTATFNGFWILSAELLQAIFIVTTVLFFALAFLEAVKVIKSKITGKGNDDWFVLRVQGLENPKKTGSFGETIVDFFCFTDWIDVLKKTCLVILYLLPIGLWLLVMFLVGWQVAWSTAIPEGGTIDDGISAQLPFMLPGMPEDRKLHLSGADDHAECDYRAMRRRELGWVRNWRIGRLEEWVIGGLGD